MVNPVTSSSGEDYPPPISNTDKQIIKVSESIEDIINDPNLTDAQKAERITSSINVQLEVLRNVQDDSKLDMLKQLVEQVKDVPNTVIAEMHLAENPLIARLYLVDSNNSDDMQFLLNIISPPPGSSAPSPMDVIKNL